jgi:hypothetical protein
MRPSTILATLLPALAIASPATIPPAASQGPQALIDYIIKNLNVPSVPMDLIEDLRTCLSDHKGFHTDFSKAEDGAFSISNVDRTCCEKAQGIWGQLPPGDYGYAHFSEPCEGATVTGTSEYHMQLLRAFFGSI